MCIRDRLCFQATGHALEDDRQLFDARQQCRAGGLQSLVRRQLAPGFLLIAPQMLQSRGYALDGQTADPLTFTDPRRGDLQLSDNTGTVSYTHLRAHETV